MRALKRCYPSQTPGARRMGNSRSVLTSDARREESILARRSHDGGKFGYRCSKDIVYRAVKQLESRLAGERRRRGAQRGRDVRQDEVSSAGSRSMGAGGPRLPVLPIKCCVRKRHFETSASRTSATGPVSKSGFTSRTSAT